MQILNHYICILKSLCLSFSFSLSLYLSASTPHSSTFFAVTSTASRMPTITPSPFLLPPRPLSSPHTPFSSSPNACSGEANGHDELTSTLIYQRHSESRIGTCAQTVVSCRSFCNSPSYAIAGSTPSTTVPSPTSSPPPSAPHSTPPPPELCPYCLAYLLPGCVCRIVYLDSDVVLVIPQIHLTVCYISQCRRRLWWSITGYEGGAGEEEQGGICGVLCGGGSQW